MDKQRRRRLATVAVLMQLAASVAAQHDLAPVRLNGVPVIEVGGSGEEPAHARAQRIERRLQRVIDRPDLAGAPGVGPGTTPDSRVIEWQGLPIVTVTRAAY